MAGGVTAPTSGLDQFVAMQADLVRRLADLERAAQHSDVPTGGLVMFAGSIAPTGYLICNGASLLRADYPALFAAIGTTWGAVDGTHFTLPDMRGRAPIGAGTGTGLTARTLAANVGAETHLLSAAESGVAAHSHTQTAHTHTVDVVDQSTSSGGVPNRGLVTAGGGAKSGVINTLAPTIQDATAAAAAAAHNNMQPSAVVNFIIRT